MCVRVCAVLERERASPAVIASTVGSLNWYNLLNRYLLSIVSATYRFMRSLPEQRPRTLPRPCQRELLLNVMLAPAWSVNLGTDFADFLGMTDASPLGFGAVQAPCSSYLTRSLSALALHAEEHVTVGDPHEEPKPRRLLRPPHEVNIGPGTFSIEFLLSFDVEAYSSH